MKTIALSFFTITAALALLCFTASHAQDFECPTKYTFTSKDCNKWCNQQPEADSGACVYYPVQGKFPCSLSSVGYCQPTSSDACEVKCLSKNFVVENSLTLGIRGEIGSFGRSEPIEVIEDLEIANVTSFSLKDYLLADNAEPTHNLTLQNKGMSLWPLKSLDLTNAAILMMSPWHHQNKTSSLLLPTTLETLVLKNTKLRDVTPLALRTMKNLTTLSLANNALASFPKVIFQLKTLRHLNVRGNPMQKPIFSKKQVAFLKHLETFEADFDI